MFYSFLSFFPFILKMVIMENADMQEQYFLSFLWFSNVSQPLLKDSQAPEVLHSQMCSMELR